jgi:predicted ATPase/DNA-binding response OmpR family regulator/Tfp pilus assembly protein PilF
MPNVSRLRLVLINADQPLQERVEALQPLFDEVMLCDTANAPAFVAAHSPDLIVIDIDQVVGEELALCRRIRQHSTAPLLVVAQPTAERRLLSVFDLGVDGFLFKPVSTPNLQLSIEAALRRRKAEQHRSALRLGPQLVFDVQNRQLLHRNAPVELTFHDTLLLRELASQMPNYVGAEELIRQLWSMYDAGLHANLRQQIKRLRQRLKQLNGMGEVIVNRPKLGYALVLPETLPPPELPAPPKPAPPYQLPTFLTSFIGRAEEIEAVAQLLRRPDRRLVTLLGPAGIGKTRLSSAVASTLRDYFEDGIYWVALAPVRDEALLYSTIAHALGISDSGELPVRDALVARLRGRRVLLVLDNFEQLVEAAPLISDLLIAVPTLSVLVSSRRPLQLSGEQRYVVPPLELPPDVDSLSATDAQRCSPIALFTTRAQQVKPSFVLDDVATIAAICERLDGLPLAIELAAARSDEWAPVELLNELAQRLPVLYSTNRDTPARQRTMQAAIDWSYTLLRPVEQVLFRRVGVFAGGGTLEAVQAVCLGDTDPAAVETLCDALVGHSLLRREAVGDDVRYTMLPIIQEYAQQKLITALDDDIIRARYAAFFRELATNAVEQYGGPDEIAWLDQLACEHDNLRAVLQDSLTQGGNTTALTICSAIWRFWYYRGYAREGRQWLERSLAQHQHATPAIIAEALHGAGALAWLQGDLVEARELLEQAIEVHQMRETPQDTVNYARVLDTMGSVVIDLGDAPRAQQLYHMSLRLHQMMGNLRGQANVLNSLGSIALNQGNYTEAQRHYQESIAVAEESGNIMGLAQALANMATAACGEKNLEVAQSALHRSLALSRSIDSGERMIYPLMMLALIATDQCIYTQAVELLAEALVLASDLDSVLNSIECLEATSYLLANIGAMPSAAALWQTCVHLRDLYRMPMEPVDQARYTTLATRLAYLTRDTELLELDQALDYARECLHVILPQQRERGDG